MRNVNVMLSGLVQPFCIGQYAPFHFSECRYAEGHHELSYAVFLREKLLN